MSMTLEEANCIELTTILDRLNAKPVKQKGHEVWYSSPLRNEKTASFHVHTGKNVWYDFGEARGGSSIDFVVAYLSSQNEDHTIIDALRWLTNMNIAISPIAYPTNAKYKNDDVSIVVKQVMTLHSQILIRYLQSRGIPSGFAKKYVKQVSAFNKKSGKTFLALGFRNEDNGIELRNAFFKGCISPKTISFIRGAVSMTKEIHVFEGFMDFLSVLSSQKKGALDGDVIVLNSVACLQLALPYIRNYGYETLYSWTDNDNAGEKTKLAIDRFVKTQAGLIHKPMNGSFAPYKDVNEWHMNQLGLVK